MKTTIAWAVPALLLALASGCGGPSKDAPGDLIKPSASGLVAGASQIDGTAPSGIEGSKIAVSAKTRTGADSENTGRDLGRAAAAKVLNASVDAIVGRAARSTALLEVAIGKDPTGITRTGVAFCVDTSGLFITHANVVKGVTEPTGQVRMILGEGLEARTAVLPKILRVDEETGLASLEISPDPELRLEALGLARSGEVSPDTEVVVFGFPRGMHYAHYDSKGFLLDGPKFDFVYGSPWGKELPDHLIIPVRVGKAWLEDGRPRLFEIHEVVVDRSNITIGKGSSGAPALDAAGEVVGVVTIPENMGLFLGMVSVEQLSKFLGRAPGGGLAGTPAQGDRFEVIRKGKKATALVEVSTRLGECSGTAFCVDRSGLFVTNAHVVEDATTGARHDVNLVMEIGLPTQRTARARIIRLDKKVDLALLKIDADPQLEVLDLGQEGDLLPTLPIAAFGFPFGRRITPRADEPSYPDVAVNANRLTAIDRDNVSHAVTQLRFDGQLNPGNSGGPVLDPKGKVVGVAVATILGASINFAIPVGRLREFLAVPGIEVRSLPVAFEDRARPTTWTIRVVPSQFARLPDDLSVAVTIADGTREPRKLQPRAGGGAGMFTLEFVPRPRDPGRGVALALRLGDRPENLPVAVEDLDVTIGGEPFKLSALRHVAVRPKPWALLPDERVIKGPIVGLGKVSARQGNQRKTIDLGAANEFTVISLQPERYPVVDSLIEVRTGGPNGTILCESRSRMELTDGPSTAPPPGEPGPKTTEPPELEKRLTLTTRTLPREARNAAVHLLDEEGPFRKGDDLYVTGVPRGSIKAIRPPRVAVGKALVAEASAEGLGTRSLDFPRPTVNTERAIDGACFSQDGSRLALGLPGSIQVYDVASGKLIRELNQPHASLLAFSANNAKLVAYSPAYHDRTRMNPSRSGFHAVPARGPVEWDLKTGTTASPPPMPDIERVPLRWISAGGRFVAVNTGIFQCRDLRSGKATLVIQDDKLIGFPSPTPDGKRLLSFYARPSEPSRQAAAAAKNVRARGPAAAPMQPPSANLLRVHELETGRLLFEMDLAGMTLVGLVPGTDTGVFEAAGGVMVVRDLRTGKELRRVTLRPDSAPGNASPRARQLRSDERKPQLTPDGKRLVKPAPDGGYVVFDLVSGAELGRQATIASIETATGDEVVMPPSGRTALILVWRDCCLWTLPDAAALSASVAARKPEAPTVRELGGTATAVAVGGAGRYLLLTLAQARQLAVFDANAADVVKTMPLPSENAMVAAGASKFVIADPDTKRIERRDLGSFARDGEPQPLPFDGTLEAIALGADSEGPLLANWSTAKTGQGPVQNRFGFIDLATLRIQAVGVIAVHGMNERAAKLAASGGEFTLWVVNRIDLRPRIRASHDGSLFGITWTGNPVQEVEVGLKAEAGMLTVSHDATERWRAAQPYLIPSPDGRRFFHGKTGIRDAVFYETPARDRIGRSSEKSTVSRLPSADPRFDISLRTAEAITFLRAEDGAGIATVTGLDEMAGVLQDDDIVRDGISLDHRYHFVPAAKLLVTIPPTNDRLVLRRLDLDAAPVRAGTTR